MPIESYRIPQNFVEQYIPFFSSQLASTRCLPRTETSAVERLKTRCVFFHRSLRVQLWQETPVLYDSEVSSLARDLFEAMPSTSEEAGK